MHQLKVNQQEAAGYFDVVFNNTTMNIVEQDDNIIQFYRDVANQAQANSKEKIEPNSKSMSKAMEKFTEQGRGA